MDVLTKEQRHRNMSNIKNKDTKIELILRTALWQRGYRYRKNYKNLPGKPDIVFTKYKIAIFCDSEFFHGKDWEEQKIRLQKANNSGFWLEKIQSNIDRDTRINQELRMLGWKVLRFWGNDIKKKTEECIRTIEEAMFDYEMEREDDFVEM